MKRRVSTRDRKQRTFFEPSSTVSGSRPEDHQEEDDEEVPEDQGEQDEEEYDEKEMEEEGNTNKKRKKKKTLKKKTASNKPSTKRSELLSSVLDNNVSLVQVVRELLDDTESSDSLWHTLCLLLLESFGISDEDSEWILSLFHHEDGYDQESLSLQIAERLSFSLSSHLSIFPSPFSVSENKDRNSKQTAKEQGWKNFQKFWQVLGEEAGESMWFSEDGSSSLSSTLELVAVLSKTPLQPIRLGASLSLSALSLPLLSFKTTIPKKAHTTLKQLKVGEANKIAKGTKEQLKGDVDKLKQSIQSILTSASTQHHQSIASLSESVVKIFDAKSFPLARKSLDADILDRCESLLDHYLTCVGSCRAIVRALKERVRDTDENVREVAVSALALATCKDLTLLPITKAAMEKALGDPSASVRTVACLAVKFCMSASLTSSQDSEGSDDDELDEGRRGLSGTVNKERLKWGKKVRKEIGKFLLLDKEPTVAQAALQALTAVQKVVAEKEDTEDQALFNYKRCLCLEDTEENSFRDVRVEAARVALLLFFDKDQAIVDGVEGHDNPNEESTGGESSLLTVMKMPTITPRSQRRKLNKRSGGKGEEETENPAETNVSGVTRARLELSQFLELLSDILGNASGTLEGEDFMDVDQNSEEGAHSPKEIRGEDGEDQDGELVTMPEHLMKLIVDAFWDFEAAGFLKNWNALLSSLQSYGHAAVAGKIGIYKARLLASLLLAASQRSEEIDPEIKSKRERRQLEDERETLVESLHHVLLEFLPDCISAFRADPAVLLSLIPLLEYIDPAKCSKDIELRRLEKLVDKLVAVFEQQKDPKVLHAVVNTLTEQICHGEDHLYQKEAREVIVSLEKRSVDALRKCTDALLNALSKDSENEETSSRKGKTDIATLAALETHLRRVNILARLCRSYASFPLDAEDRRQVATIARHLVLGDFEMCNKDNNTDSASQRNQLVNVFSEALLLLQVDFQQTFGLSAALVQSGTGASTRRSQEVSEEFAKHLGDAEKQVKCIGAVLEELADLSHLPPTLADHLSIVALPCYTDLCTLTTKKLQDTELYKLVWNPSAELRQWMDKCAVAVCQGDIPSQEDKSNLFLSGPGAIRQACLVPVLRTRLQSVDSQQTVDAFTRLLLSKYAQENQTDGVTRASDEAKEEEEDDGEDEENEVESLREKQERAGLAKAARLYYSKLTEASDAWPAVLFSFLQEEYVDMVQMGDENVEDMEEKVKAFVPGNVSARRKCSDKHSSMVVELVRKGFPFALSKPSHLNFLHLLVSFVSLVKPRFLSTIREIWTDSLKALPQDTAQVVFQDDTKKHAAFALVEKCLGVSTKPKSPTATEQQHHSKKENKNDQEDDDQDEQKEPSNKSVESESQAKRSRRSSPTSLAARSEGDESTREIEKNLYASDEEEESQQSRELPVRTSRRPVTPSKDALFQDNNDDDEDVDANKKTRREPTKRKASEAEADDEEDEDGEASNKGDSDADSEPTFGMRPSRARKRHKN